MDQQRLEQVLAPISDSQPGGDDLAYSPLFDQVREARRSDDPSLAVGDWVTSVKTADWRKARQLAEEALTSKSKDLQLAVWYAEALARLEGFGGVQFGFAVLGGLLERFWATLWPELDPHDLDERVGKLEWLNGVMGQAIREVALTSPQAGAYDWYRYKSSRDVENIGLKDPDARERAIAEGGLAGDVFDKSVLASGPAFYVALNAQLGAARAEFDTFDTVCETRFGMAAPNLSEIRKALQDCADVVGRLLEQCGGQVAPAVAAPAGVAAVADTTGQAMAAPVPVSAAVALGPIQTRGQAVQQLRAVAVYFRNYEPHSPVALLAERAARWAEMPLEDWLQTVIKDDSTLSQLRELLDIKRD